MKIINLVEYCRQAIDNVEFYHPKLTTHHRHIASLILVDWHKQKSTPYPSGWYSVDIALVVDAVSKYVESI